jgi:ElaB/YqjD/DUF883 family membrane-anchored ribosome-binding protein
MLNTPTDYHTFDRTTVKKALRNNTYKWSCLVVTLLLCALIMIMWYWDEMMGAPQKFVKIDRSLKTRAINNVSMDKSDVIDHMRETMGMVANQGEVFLTTLIDEAEDIANQMKAGADSLGADGAEILDSAGDQLKQIANTAADDLANLATEIGDELKDVIATTIDKAKDAGIEAIESAQNAASSNH